MLVGLAAGTRSTYASRQRAFIDYCALHNLEPLPASELTLLKYLASLFHSKLSSSTCNGHITAIRNLHIINGLQDPTVGRERLALVKRGIAVNIAPLPLRAAVTDIHIKSFLDCRDLNLFDDKCFFAMSVIGFFGFFRISEMTYDSKVGFSPSTSLNPSDVSW